MKITKLKTRYGEFGSPVSTDLETIIERMRSEDSKAATETIRRAALQLRLMMATVPAVLCHLWQGWAGTSQHVHPAPTAQHPLPQGYAERQRNEAARVAGTIHHAGFCRCKRRDAEGGGALFLQWRCDTMGFR